MRYATSLLTWSISATALAASGVFYVLVFIPEFEFYIGAIFALFCGMPLVAFQRGSIAPRLLLYMRQLPTWAFIVLSLAVDFALISCGFAAAGALLKSLDLLRTAWSEVMLPPANVCLYALGASSITTIVMHVRDLLGRDVFMSLLTGRYRNPVREERVFAFIDIAGSTEFAAQHGDLRAQQLIGAVFAAFDEPVQRHGGAIDDYVGDAAIITWPMKAGVRNAACLRCVFNILESMEENRKHWVAAYGRVPRLRAALHGGPIITAEIGVLHHKITYFGDTINTTARLEHLCKTLERPVLMSQDLAERMSIPVEFIADDLGEHAVKGRGQPIGVLALRAR